MRRQKSLRIGVHHANVVVWGPVYRTHLTVDEVRHAADLFLVERPRLLRGGSGSSRGRSRGGRASCGGSGSRGGDRRRRAAAGRSPRDGRFRVFPPRRSHHRRRAPGRAQRGRISSSVRPVRSVRPVHSVRPGPGRAQRRPPSSSHRAPPRRRRRLRRGEQPQHLLKRHLPSSRSRGRRHRVLRHRGEYLARLPRARVRRDDAHERGELSRVESSSSPRVAVVESAATAIDQVS